MRTSNCPTNGGLRFSCDSELGIDLLHSLREAEGEEKVSGKAMRESPI